MKTENLTLSSESSNVVQYLSSSLTKYQQTVELSALVKDVATITRFDEDSVTDALLFLAHCDVITITDSNIISNNCIGDVGERKRDPLQAFQDFIIRKISEDGTLSELSNGVQPGMQEDGLLVDQMLIPIRLNGYRDLLLSLGVFQRESFSQRHWVVNPEYHKFFLNVISDKNEIEFHTKGMSKKDLDEQIERNNQYGKDAEEWVLKYEHKRLNGHLFINQIARISDDNVGAGYDITSFKDTNSLQHDNFIEVKSYSGKPHFYWSKNEIKTAKEYGEEYQLILVDRNKMYDAKYHPITIKGPYNYFFSSDAAEWTFEVENYLFAILR
jgi:hypothetical protein